MKCEHWFKFDGICKHCGYTQPMPSLELKLRNPKPETGQTNARAVMRATLEAIQKLHPITYKSAADEAWEYAPRCETCRAEYPCETRKLTDTWIDAV